MAAAEPSDGEVVMASLGLAAMAHVCNQAKEEGEDIPALASTCHRLYGRGAFFVYFRSEKAVKSRHASEITALIEDYVNAALQKESQPLVAWDGLEDAVQEDLMATFVDCPEGQISGTALYRKASVLVTELGNDSEAARELQSFDPLTSVCFVGQVRTGVAGQVYTAVYTRPLTSVFSLSDIERQTSLDGQLAEEQKRLGNKKLQGGDIPEARKHYVEALRLVEGDTGLHQLKFQVEQNLCLCAIKQEAWQECRERCGRLLEGMSDGAPGSSAKLFYRLGLSSCRLGAAAEEGPVRTELYTEAVEHLKQAAALEPSDKVVKELLEEAMTGAGVSRLESSSDLSAIPQEGRLQAASAQDSTVSTSAQDEAMKPTPSVP